jgi:hypothetical protein
MSRSIILWRTWDGSDMAQSDQFFATKTAALRSLKDHYDVTEGMLKPDGEHRWSFEHERWGDVHLARVTVKMTKDGIANALINLPHR